MNTPANTFSTYDAIGIVEELHNDITMITPWETPVLSALPSGSCDTTYVEWQTDDLAAPSTTNYRIEGEDASVVAITPTTRVGNRTQISDKVFKITGREERVKKAGRQSEIDYQSMKKGRELLTDNESTLIGLYQTQTAGSTAAASKLANFTSWIKTNTAGGDTAPATSGTTVPTVVGNSAFTETMFNTVMQSQWEEGGNATKFFVPGSIKAKISSTFVGRATETTADAAQKSVNGVVDILVTDFGTVQVIPCRNIKSNIALLIDPSKAEVLWLRPTFRKDLAILGDSYPFQILNEFTLKVHNEKAHGAFYGITA